MNGIFAQYEERLIRLRRHPDTVQGFRQAVRPIEEAFPGRAPEDLEAWELEELWASLPLQPSTKRQYLTGVRAAYRYAQRRGVLAHDPTHLVAIERVPDREPTILSSADLRWIRSRARAPRQELLFHLLAYTGMRSHEIRALEWAHVNITASSLCVQGKGGKLRYVPIHPALGELLPRRYHLGERVIRNVTYKALHRFAPEVGGFHMFRRTVASSLALNGVLEREIDRIMGWAPRTVGRRYYINVADDVLQRAILRLYADDPI